MNPAYAMSLLAAFSVGFAIVRWTSIRISTALGLGLAAGACYWSYLALFADSDDWALDRELTLMIGAAFLATMFAAWLVGVGAAWFLRRRASVQS